MAYYYRGDVKSYLGKHEEAIKDYDKAIELKPLEVMPYNNRGLAKFHLGKYEEAIRDFEKALELDPNFADARTNREKTIFSLEYEKKQ